MSGAFEKLRILDSNATKIASFSTAFVQSGNFSASLFSISAARRFVEIAFPARPIHQAHSMRIASFVCNPDLQTLGLGNFRQGRDGNHFVSPDQNARPVPTDPDPGRVIYVNLAGCAAVSEIMKISVHEFQECFVEPSQDSQANVGRF